MTTARLARGGMLSICVLAFFSASAHAAVVDLMVGSFTNHEVLAYDSGTGSFLGPFIGAGSGGLANPTGIAAGPDGNFFVSSPGAGLAQVMRYTPSGQPDPSGANPGAVFAQGNGLSFPQGLTFDASGNLYVSSAGSNSVLEFNGATGAFIQTFVTGGSGGLTSPTGLVFGPNGDLFVLSSATNQVLEYNGATGAFVKVYSMNTPSGANPLSGPLDLRFDPSHNLFVSNNSASTVTEFDSTGAFVKDLTIAPTGTNRTSGPSGLDLGPDGNLYIGTFNNNAVYKYTLSSQTLSTFVPAGSGGLNNADFLRFYTPAVPEPGSLVLLASGGALLCGLGARRFRLSARRR